MPVFPHIENRQIIKISNLIGWSLAQASEHIFLLKANGTTYPSPQPTGDRCYQLGDSYEFDYLQKYVCFVYIEIPDISEIYKFLFVCTDHLILLNRCMEFHNVTGPAFI